MTDACPKCGCTTWRTYATIPIVAFDVRKRYRRCADCGQPGRTLIVPLKFAPQQPRRRLLRIVNRHVHTDPPHGPME